VRRHDPITESLRVIAVQDGEFLGNLILFFRRQGSPDWEAHAPFVNVWGGVVRVHRRRGIGRALLVELLAFMERQGKTVATFKVHVPDGHAFMTAIGAIEKYRNSENHLELDRLDWDELARWEAQATRPGDGIAWERHAGRVPMDRLAALLPTFTALFFEQPLGALQVPNPYVLQNYITWYAEMDRRGGEHFLLLLRHGDEVAAMCDASWDGRFPERVYQQLTAVARPWRGKGLAKGVKAAMLKLIRARRPQARTMITNNADANGAIWSINRRLGFVVHRHDGTYQVGREELARFIVRQGERRGR
jgi:GNAT superfamily N-acetyltransferase